MSHLGLSTQSPLFSTLYIVGLLLDLGLLQENIIAMTHTWIVQLRSCSYLQGSVFDWCVCVCVCVCSPQWIPFWKLAGA